VIRLIELCTVYPQCAFIVCFVSFICLSLFPFYFLSFLDLVGISSADLHETSLVHLGEPSGLKDLLHMLNATVIPTIMS